jgi:CBS domain-containing protein
MNKEIYERPKMHVNIGTMHALGKTAKDFVLSVEDIYSKPPKTVSAQDLIEEARKARELDERQEA